MTTETLVGKTVSFWAHMTDEMFTGVVQQSVLLNGEETILVFSNGTYNLFRLANIYGLEILDNEGGNEDDIDPEHDECIEGTEHNEGNHDTNQENENFPTLRQAVSIIRNSILSQSELDVSRCVPCTTCQDPGVIVCEEQEQEPEPEPELCTICLDAIDMSQNAVALSCCHKFHFNCIMKNMSSTSSMQNNCPLCRTPVMEGYSVCSDDVSIERMNDRLVRETEHLTAQLERRRMLEGLILLELRSIQQSQRQILEARRVLDHTAFQLLTQSANQTDLYEKISHLVCSAANNNIRENYEELHDFYEEEIRNLCFSLGMHVLCRAREEGEEGEDENDNEEVDYGQNEEIEEVVQQGNLAVNPVIIE